MAERRMCPASSVDISRRRRGGMPSNARMGDGERGTRRRHAVADPGPQDLGRCAPPGIAGRGRGGAPYPGHAHPYDTPDGRDRRGCGGAATSASDPPGRIAFSSAGVRVVIPTAWRTVEPTSDRPVTDPRTLLVVGTDGVRAKRSQCQIAAYRVPARGAVVVVVGWAPGEWPGRQGRGVGTPHAREEAIVRVLHRPGGRRPGAAPPDGVPGERDGGRQRLPAPDSRSACRCPLLQPLSLRAPPTPAAGSGIVRPTGAGSRPLASAETPGG
jgi:hypothetical protein